MGIIRRIAILGATSQIARELMSFWYIRDRKVGSIYTLQSVRNNS